MVRCNYCGEPLTFEGVEVLFFNYDGSDSWQKVDIHECDNEALYIELLNTYHKETSKLKNEIIDLGEDL